MLSFPNSLINMQAEDYEQKINYEWHKYQIICEVFIRDFFKKKKKKKKTVLDIPLPWSFSYYQIKKENLK